MRISTPKVAAAVALCMSAALLVPMGTGASAAPSPRADEPVPWDWTPVNVPPVTVDKPVVPVFVAVGKDKPVAGAKVEIRSDGQVIATGTTGAGGVALIEEAGLPDDYDVRITGGTVDGKASTAVLLSKYDPEGEMVGADLVTTLIEKFKTQTGTTDWGAHYRVNKSLGLIWGVDDMNSRFSTDQRFDGSKFIAAANKRGGLDKYMKWLIPQIDKGKKFTFRGKAQQRSTSSDLLSDAAGDLGGYLGLPSPGADIQKKAQQAAQTMQKAFTDMLTMEWKTQILVNQSIYTTETAKVSDFESGVKFINNKWGTFVQSNVADPGYDSLRKELYNDIRKNVYDHYPQVENYFPASTQGVLKAGHSVFQSMYGYYLPNDVTQIQGMVGYWESLAAAGNLYIVNMYSYDPSLQPNIATQNQYAQKTDARVLKAMPVSLVGTELGLWRLGTAGRAYTKNSSLWMDYKVITDMAESWGNCSGWSQGYSKTGSPTYISRTDLNNKYKALVPSGYTWAPTSDSQYFTVTRAGGSSFLDVVHSQDTGVAFLVYNDTNVILGQQHTYKDDWGNTKHSWSGQTVCNATWVGSGGTTISNQNNVGGGYWVTAMVYREATLVPPASF